ncbi:hypothetical protein [Sphingomonas sp. BK235]|uniref:hypothetical protein n=1 Tax=Sphingomonas sp. BK235 TaxID=2512131 RepID=UPI00104735D6|nr:hypothetical protein [Sphingomonas sp. BK235]TCP33716.1 hypothetical protein EV292_105166 [Sphingomonas sp. BK235]
MTLVPVARLVATMVLFLEQTDEAQLDLDYAVKVAEYLCPSLRALSYLSDGALVVALDAVAQEVGGAAAALVRSVADGFALHVGAGAAFPEPVEPIEADRARALAAGIDPLAAALARLVATYLLLLQGASEEVVAPAARARAVWCLIAGLERLDRAPLDRLIAAFAFVAPAFDAEAWQVTAIPTRYGLRATGMDRAREPDRNARCGALTVAELARVYAAAYIFLEQTGEERLDLDANVTLGEYIGHALDHLEREQTPALIAALAALAATLGPEEAAIVRGIAESHGLPDRDTVPARLAAGIAYQRARCDLAAISPIAAVAAHIVTVFTLLLERCGDEEIEPGVDDDGLRRLTATLHALPPASLAELIAAFDVIAPDFTTDADAVRAIPRDFKLLEALAGAAPVVDAPATLRRARAGLPPRVSVPRQIG